MQLEKAFARVPREILRWALHSWAVGDRNSILLKFAQLELSRHSRHSDSCLYLTYCTLQIVSVAVVVVKYFLGPVAPIAGNF